MERHGQGRAGYRRFRSQAGESGPVQDEQTRLVRGEGGREGKEGEVYRLRVSEGGIEGKIAQEYRKVKLGFE